MLLCTFTFISTYSDSEARDANDARGATTYVVGLRNDVHSDTARRSARGAARRAHPVLRCK